MGTSLILKLQLSQHLYSADLCECHKLKQPENLELLLLAEPKLARGIRMVPDGTKRPDRPSSTDHDRGRPRFCNSGSLRVYHLTTLSDHSAENALMTSLQYLRRSHTHKNDDILKKMCDG